MVAGVLAAAVVLAMVPGGEGPLFRFGLVADTQYADKPTAGTRHYAGAAQSLARCVADLKARKVAFAVNLGDIIDGRGDESRTDLDAMLALWAGLGKPVRHAIGNHCLSVPRKALLPALGLRRGWYEFRKAGWRFIVLDGLDVSAAGPTGPKAAELARQYLALTPKLPEYDGAIGREQLNWLRVRLADARARGDKVVIFCHLPVHPDATTAPHLLWNHAEVLSAVQNAGCVRAWFAGHDHAGGYAYRGGIHHLTQRGMVEAPEGSNAYSVVSVYPDRLVVDGVGLAASRTLDWSDAR